MNFKTRETWNNVAGNQTAHPLRQYEPENIAQIIDIIKEAEKHNLPVRAIGSSHSWSDVGVTTGFLVKPDKLDKVMALDAALLKDQVDKSTLFQVESGLTIRKLNEELDAKGLALINMGGYDAQTIAGVISTSTHGSGIEFGPLSDFVESLEIVSDGGLVYRIEPTNGITKPAEYKSKYPQRKLIQDDDWFNAVVVSMGCMGVIYSVILRVTKKYWLKEKREVATWDQIKEDLKKGDVLKNHRHYEVLVNPHKVDGQHRCLITTRNITTSVKNSLFDDRTNRNFIELLLPVASEVAKLLLNIAPNQAGKLINDGLKALVDKAYINVSYKVFNIGVANEIPALSAEIGFPLKGHTYIAAVDKFLEVVEQHESLGGLYHSAPISLRFVKASEKFLSMMHGCDTCMMEIIMAKETRGAVEMMHRYENELYRFSGRPHWGQINSLTGSHDLVKSMYPKYNKWLDIYKKLNKNGTFDSPFSKRVGFRKESFVST